jgi:hypothetical protein
MEEALGPLDAAAAKGGAVRELLVDLIPVPGQANQQVNDRNEPDDQADAEEE